MGDGADLFDMCVDEEMMSGSEKIKEWEKGYHTDRTGKVWKLSEMTDQHLRNTINYFSDYGYDTKPLELELKSRDL